MGEVQFRAARQEDVGAIVALLADDPLGAQREDPSDLPAYAAAFAAVEEDPRQSLIVAVEAGRVVGTMQISVLPGLARKGALRGQIEAVRIVRDRRGAGLGARMITFALDLCRERGCTSVQLTTHGSRHDAHRFYERLGFEPTHVGYTLTL